MSKITLKLGSRSSNTAAPPAFVTSSDTKLLPADMQRKYIDAHAFSMGKWLDKLSAQDFTYFFRQPVDTVTYSDYLTVVKTPMDLSTIQKKLE